MGIGAVAEIAEAVARLREGCLTDPGHTFAPRLAEGLGGVRAEPRRHVVAADAGKRPTPLRHLGRAVVRAARAVVRDTHHAGARNSECLLLGIEKIQPFPDALA